MLTALSCVVTAEGMSELDPSHFNLFLLRNLLDADTCANLKTELALFPTTQAPVYIEGSEGGDS